MSSHKEPTIQRTSKGREVKKPKRFEDYRDFSTPCSFENSRHLENSERSRSLEIEIVNKDVRSSKQKRRVTFSDTVEELLDIVPDSCLCPDNVFTNEECHVEITHQVKECVAGKDINSPIIAHKTVCFDTAAEVSVDSTGIMDGKRVACSTSTCKAEELVESNRQCYRCKKYVCYRCSGLEEQVVKALSLSPENNVWFCLKCTKPALTAVETDKEIEVRCESYFKRFTARMQKVEDQVKVLTSRVDEKVDKVVVEEGIEELRAKVATLEKQIQASGKSQAIGKGDSNLSMVVRRELSEQQDIEARRLSLIITGMKESEVAGSKQLQQEADAKAFKELIAKEFELNVTTTDTFRVGQPRDDDKPRLMKVTFRGLADKKMILARAKQLRQSEDNPDIFIRPDLTIRQREQAKNLREELSKVRDRNPTKRYKIKANKVVEVPGPGEENQDA